MKVKRKTSVYLGPEDISRLHRLAKQHRTTYAALIRKALALYEATERPNRQFAMAGAWAGDGTSVADVAEQDLLRGFGE
jgi:predicted transcriptional regulator